jgi:phosphatidate cytidylyltransferase
MEMSSAIWTLFIIFIGLVVVNILFLQIKRKQREKDFSRITLRVKTWWGMFVVFCLATLFNPIISMFSLMVLCFFSLKEYFSMMKTRKSDRRIFLWAYLSIPIQFYWIYIGWYGMFIVFIPVYVFLLLPLPRILGKGTLGFLRSVSSTQWGLMLMVFGLSHLAYYQIATPVYGANMLWKAKGGSYIESFHYVGRVSGGDGGYDSSIVLHVPLFDTTRFEIRDSLRANHQHQWFCRQFDDFRIKTGPPHR